MSVAKTLAPLVDFVLSPRCPLCGEGLAAQGGLCLGCWDDLVIPGKPACRSCARPFTGAPRGSAVCAECRAHPPLHDGIAAATIYNETSRKLVLAFKHGNRIALAPMMARLIAARLETVSEDWLIVPVPLHRWRLWQRGFNQAAVLASELAKLTNARLCVDALVRSRKTPMLGERSARERQRLLAGAIAANPGRRALLRAAKVLLIDDVLTSGATSHACITALKDAGAQRVVIGCFARVLDEALEHRAEKWEPVFRD
jgi:ComF family protein